MVVGAAGWPPTGTPRRLPFLRCSTPSDAGIPQHGRQRCKPAPIFGWGSGRGVLDQTRRSPW